MSLYSRLSSILGFPGGSVVKKNLPANAGDTGSIPGWGKFPGKGNGNPLPVFLPEKSHGQRNLEGYSLLLFFSCSFVSDSLQPHGLQHARLPCSSPPPGVCSNSCPLSRWCHSIISSFVIPFPDSSGGKESARNAGDMGSIPGLGRSPGEGKGYPLQYSGLKKNIVHGVGQESDKTEWLSLSLPAFKLSQHRGLFQWVGCSQQVGKVLELQLQHQSFQWIFRVSFL